MSYRRCARVRDAVVESPSASSPPSSRRADPARLAAGRRVRGAAREAPARAALRCFDRARELALPTDPVALARAQSGHVTFGSRRGNGHRGLLAVRLMASVPGRSREPTFMARSWPGHAPERLRHRGPTEAGDVETARRGTGDRTVAAPRSALTAASGCHEGRPPRRNAQRVIDGRARGETGARGGIAWPRLGRCSAWSLPAARAPHRRAEVPRPATAFGAACREMAASLGIACSPATRYRRLPCPRPRQRAQTARRVSPVVSGPPTLAAVDGGAR